MFLVIQLQFGKGFHSFPYKKCQKGLLCTRLGQENFNSIGNVIPNWCGIGYHCWYHNWYPDLTYIYHTNTGLHPTQSPGLLAIKFEKFDLSFMIALVNLSSNASSVSRNVCQRLCALPHMHQSIYFPNLRSKPKVMCTPSYAPVYLLSKSQIQASRKGWDRIWGSHFVLMRLSMNIYIT